MLTKALKAQAILSFLTMFSLSTSMGANGNPAAPSFDCRRAAQEDEAAVCANPNLSELDQLLAVGFHYLAKHNGKPAAQTLARTFLSNRKACGSKIDCIQSAYVKAMIEYQHAGAPVMVPGWAIKILPEVIQPVAPVARPSELPDKAKSNAVISLESDLAKLDLERRYYDLPYAIGEGKVTTKRVAEITLDAQAAGIVSEGAVRQGSATAKVVLECVAQGAERAEVPPELLHGAMSKLDVQMEMADRLLSQCEPAHLDTPTKVAIAIGRRAMFQALS